MTLKQSGFATAPKTRHTRITSPEASELEETRRSFDRGEELITLDEAWKAAKAKKTTGTANSDALQHERVTA